MTDFKIATLMHDKLSNKDDWNDFNDPFPMQYESLIKQKMELQAFTDLMKGEEKLQELKTLYADEDADEQELEDCAIAALDSFTAV